MNREARRAAHRIWTLLGRPGAALNGVCGEPTNSMLHCEACDTFADVAAEFVIELTAKEDE